MAEDTTKYGVIEGKAYWSFLTSPNTKFEPVWSIDVSLDKANRKKVEADGLSVKNKGDDRGDFITIKRRTTKKDGEARRAPEVIDAHLNAWDGRPIGNGSTVRVKYAAYDYPIPGQKGKMGRSADLVKVQVVNLIPYKSDDQDFEVIEEGFVLKDAANF